MKAGSTLAILVLTLTSFPIEGSDMVDDRLAVAKREIGHQLELIGEALKTANCERVSEFFDESFNFYFSFHAEAWHIDSRQQVVDTCLEIPRPFPVTRYAVNELLPLAPDSVLSLRVLHLLEGTGGDYPKQEVITQVWRHDHEGQWRIRHMHVSITGMPRSATDIQRR